MLTEILMLTPVFQGYQGMVDGGDNIKEADWASVSGIMQIVSVFFLV